MNVTIKDRIAAHRSAPDVYDPPSFEQMANRIEELEAERCVEVRPPEWEKCGDGYKAQTVLGEYHVHPTPNPRNNKHAVYFLCAYRKSWSIGYPDNVKLAKAAAQADYEARILAELTGGPKNGNV